MQTETTYIETNGIKLHVLLAGPENGQPVFLLHGFPEFWRAWKNQIEPLANTGYRVIVPDQRGYNLSDKPNGVRSYQMDTLVKDVLGLINALGYEQVHLIGHDWGGMVAWSLAMRHPERLHKLAILNAPHPSVIGNILRRGDPDQLRRSWYIFAFQIPWLPEYFLRKNNWQGAARVLRASGRLDTFTDEDIQEYKQAWSQPGAMTAMINWYRAMARAMIRRRRPKTRGDSRVRVPVLLLWGMQDQALSHRMARLSIDYCDNGQLGAAR